VTRGPGEYLGDGKSAAASLLPAHQPPQAPTSFLQKDLELRHFFCPSKLDPLNPGTSRIQDQETTLERPSTPWPPHNPLLHQKMSSQNLRRSARLHKAPPAKDFTLFPKLPPELRVLIWEHATRCPETPAVHFFSLADLTEDLTDLYEIPTSLWYLLRPPGKLKLNRSKNPSAKCRNASGYMVDFGLWTACKESRAVIRRHWEVKPVVPLVKNPFGFDPFDMYYDHYDKSDAKNEASAVAWTLPDSDEKSYKLMLSPTKDLVCLTSLPQGGLSMIDDCWEDATGYIDGYPGFDGLTNLALPYNTRWDMLWLKYDTGDLDPLFSHILCVHGPRKLWFIDYRIKINREELKLIEQKGQSVFHGMGVRLAEVHVSVFKDRRTSQLTKSMATIDFLSELYLEEHMDMEDYERDNCVQEIGLLGVVIDG